MIDYPVDKYADEPERVVTLPPQPRTSWTATELLAATFPPPRWACPA